MSDTPDIAALEKDAVKGEPRAQYRLAIRYATGDGVARDDKVAVFWFTRAAQGDLPEAMFSLGICYEAGWGVDRSQHRAREWHYEAVKRGLEAAYMSLCLLGGRVDGGVASANPLPAGENIFWFADRMLTETMQAQARVSENPARPGVGKSSVEWRNLDS